MSFTLMTAGQRAMKSGTIKAGDFFLNEPPTDIVDGEARCWICRIDPVDGYEDTQIVVHAPHGDRKSEAKAKALAEAICRLLNADGSFVNQRV